MSFILTLVIFGILIVVHEFGHFLAARHWGIRVEKFAIGFGPPLVKIRGKETDFLICAFPLGGYVKLSGDNRQEYKGQSDEFLAKPPGVRAGVVFAGVFFNYLFALFLFWLIALTGFPYQDTVIGGVWEGYPAETSGLKEGDQVVSVNGREILGWREMQKHIQNSEQEVSLGIQRDGRLIRLTVPLKKEEVVDNFGRTAVMSVSGIYPYQNTQVGNLFEGYPAKAAGLEQGDLILAVDNVPVSSWKAMAEIIHEAKGKVLLKIKRKEQIFSLVVPVKKESAADLDGEKKVFSLIGIGPHTEVKFQRYPFFKALVKGVESLLGLTSDVFVGFSSIITGKISFKEGAAGPIGIFYITSQYVKIGIIAVLQLMAALNVSLAIINLFPIPVLDGGHLLFLLIEKIRKKTLSEKTEEFVTRLGLGLIGILVIFVFYNDTIKYGPEMLNKLLGKNKSQVSGIQESK